MQVPHFIKIGSGGSDKDGAIHLKYWMQEGALRKTFFTFAISLSTFGYSARTVSAILWNA